MSNRTLALIILLCVITGFLITLSVRQQSPAPTTIVPPKPTIAKPILQQTSLLLSPESINLSSQAGSLDVIVDTGSTDKNKVTAVQFEISYDPKMLTNVRLTAGTFFEKPIELIKNIDPVLGKVTYAVGLQPGSKGKLGKGVIASITFQSLLGAGQTTKLIFLPKTLVAAEGISTTVLKQAKGSIIMTKPVTPTGK